METKEVNIVTGGGSGIGLAATSFLPKDQITIITGRNMQKLEKAAQQLRSQGHTIEVTTCDVSCKEDLYLLAAFAQQLGTVRSVIHAAGVSASQASLNDIIKINALGVVQLVENFKNVVKPGGCLLIIGSCSSLVFPPVFLPTSCYKYAETDANRFVRSMARRCRIIPNKFYQKSMAYCISKHFVRHYVLRRAYEVAVSNRRLLCLSPGIADTELGQAELKLAETQAMLRFTGLQRPATSVEIGYTAASLTDERHGYLTGCDIFCDGGATAGGFNMFTAINKNSSHKRRSL